MERVQNAPKIGQARTALSVGLSGPLLGLIYTFSIGFGLYFILNLFHTNGSWFSYDTVVEHAGSNFFYKMIWYFMNFTEAQFYAGVLASAAMILGAFVAWRLDEKGSPLAGNRICYGSGLWPWVVASQLLSLALAIFVFNYTGWFNKNDNTWLPTFISVVNVPPAVVLLYGRGLLPLLTGSFMGGILSFPIAYWIMTTIIPILKVPGVVSNVLTMAITGIVCFQACKILPWMQRVAAKEAEDAVPQVERKDVSVQMSTPGWFVRRVLADFTEAPFYGNEIASIFLLVGVSVEWVLNSHHGAYASGAIPAIILSQYISDGWYATYVPVVSVGPACVLMFGSTVSVAVFAGVLGGILGGPVAEYFAAKLPAHIHGTVANVLSMAICTTIVALVMSALGWF
jgi:hypothetical protein